MTDCIRIATLLGEAAVALLLEALGWQLIETAPKDGTAILLTSTGQQFVGHYSAECYEWLSGNCFRSPTHWRPLPPLPVSGPTACAQTAPFAQEISTALEAADGWLRLHGDQRNLTTHTVITRLRNALVELIGRRP
jgi:hypothetical protein